MGKSIILLQGSKHKLMETLAEDIQKIGELMLQMCVFYKGVGCFPKKREAENRVLRM